MTILCIDPGSNLGAAVWDQKGTLLWYDQLKTNTKASLRDRSRAMQVQIDALFANHTPTVCVVENVLVTARSCKSKEAVFWLVVTYADVLRAAGDHRVPLVEVTPSGLKKAITGKGNCGKSLMIQAVNKRLGLSLKQSDHNRADALALGLYYFDELKQEIA